MCEEPDSCTWTDPGKSILALAHMTGFVEEIEKKSYSLLLQNKTKQKKNSDNDEIARFLFLIEKIKKRFSLRIIWGVFLRLPVFRVLFKLKQTFRIFRNLVSAIIMIKYLYWVRSGWTGKKLALVQDARSARHDLEVHHSYELCSILSSLQSETRYKQRAVFYAKQIENVVRAANRLNRFFFPKKFIQQSKYRVTFVLNSLYFYSTYYSTYPKTKVKQIIVLNSETSVSTPA